MARKAELARESRKRKKEFIQNLQEKARRYAEKVEQLEKRQARFMTTLGLTSVTRDEQKRRQEQLRLLGEMVTQLESKSSLPEKNKKLEIFMETFTSNSRARQKQLDGLMDKVREVLTPGLQAKFCLWVLSQDDKFYDDSTFWPSLAYQELGISIDQSERLKSHRKQIKERRENLRKILENLEDVRKKAQGHVTSLNNSVDRIQSHLSPEQRAKFAVWVAKNRWCMEMMTALWGKS
ncbi:hypothetical protein AAMO2058_000745300 [Amorphochlora amoebiformis]